MRKFLKIKVNNNKTNLVPIYTLKVKKYWFLKILI